MRARGRSLLGHTRVAVLAVLASLALAQTSEAAPPREPASPRESPLYGPPYRRGLAVEVALGLALCQPGLLHAGACGPRGGEPPRPGLGLRVGAGWRFNPTWYVSGAWIRQGHRPGGSFTRAETQAGMLAVRGILPLALAGRGRSRGSSVVDLGFELGAGWSQRALERDAAPLRLRSTGAVLRPALILDAWVLADLALGIEFATTLNLHWQHCVEDRCERAPGPGSGADFEGRWVDGFSVALRVTGLVYPRL